MGIIVRHSYWWFNPWSRLLFPAKMLDSFAVKKTSKQFNFLKFLWWDHEIISKKITTVDATITAVIIAVHISVSWKHGRVMVFDGFGLTFCLQSRSCSLNSTLTGYKQNILNCLAKKKFTTVWVNFQFSFCKLWPNSTKTTLHRFWVIASSLGKRHNRFDIKLRYITRRKYL